MVKKMTQVHEGVDANTWARATAYLKSISREYRPSRAATFSRHQVDEFLVNAPEPEFLTDKALAVIGIFGGLRAGSELHALLKRDFKFESDRIVIASDKRTKSIVSISFNVTAQPEKGMSCPVAIFRRYWSWIERFPQECSVWLTMRQNKGNGNWTMVRCNRGKNWVAKSPQRIAEYLRLSNPSEFRGHSFRRTAATLMADAGASLPQMQRMFRWRSESMAKVYVDSSDHARSQDSRMIQGATTTISTNVSAGFKNEGDGEVARKKGMIILSNSVLTNCTVNIQVAEGEKSTHKRKRDDDSNDFDDLSN